MDGREPTSNGQLWHALDVPDDLGEPDGDWDSVNSTAGAMIVAWDKAEEREHARALVAYATERQRALIFQALWLYSTPRWRGWAKRWLTRTFPKSFIAEKPP